MPVSFCAPATFRRLGPPLRSLVSLVVKAQRRKLGEIAVVIADDDRLRELNRQWRGIDRATDVISFAYDENEPDAATRPVAGDLVVSLDRVFEQAGRFRVTPGAELARLVVHGTLHLAGLDHARIGERRVMRGRENTILRTCGSLAKRLSAALRVVR
jgi:probable rRNA maturation factor